jgi:hypothetical protein
MIRLGTSGWQLYPGTNCGHCQPYPGLRDRFWARVFLQQFTKEAGAATAIRNLLAQDVHPWALTKITADDATDQMAILLSRGIWHVHSPILPKSDGAADNVSYVGREEADEAEVARAVPASKKPATKPTAAGDASAIKNGNEIDIIFDPNESKKVTKCQKIVHIQFMRYHADGVVINGADYASIAYRHKRSITTVKGWVIDCLGGETTPDYQQGRGDGSKNGGSANATMFDAPKTGGGDKGFYDEKSNPTGWKSVRYEFVTYGWCMKGTDCGKWYEGVSWHYTKTYKDDKAGNDGHSTILDNNVATGPSKDQIEAFDKFNADKGFTPCT